MSVEMSKDYELVKAEVLKSYEWVPERYREKFRSWRKTAGQTHMEFSREQKLWYDRWISSRKVNNDYEKLEELILLEQFKISIHPSIKMFLDERDVGSIEEAAKLADNYALTHKIYRSNLKVDTRSEFKKTGGEKFSHNTTRVANKSPNRSTGERGAGGRFNQSGSSFFEKGEKNFSKDIICYRCGKAGHISRFCREESVSKQALKIDAVAVD